MKLFHKIFLCCVIIFSMAFLTAGYLLLNYSYQNALTQEKKYAASEYQYNKYIMQSLLYNKPDLFSEEDLNLKEIANKFTVNVSFYGEDKKCIFSNLTKQPDMLAFSEAGNGKIAYQIDRSKEESHIFVYDRVEQSGDIMYLITETDISMVVQNQRKMIHYFQKIYLAIVCIFFPVIFLLTSLLTRPINKVSKAAKRIADGNYSERIEIAGHDEIAKLAINFNLMAAKVEEKIEELSDAARQKEDFAANFAHELKTPLTSVIGYADMLYQKELPRELVKNAAEYILNEGMRLEALSIKLMDLTVLDKHDFILEQMPAKDIFADVKRGMEPVCEKHHVYVHFKISEGNIEIDYDLFETMILNIVDNAIKAECKDIWITGNIQEGTYKICISDNGKGIPSEELGRITEAFYMVDKSRSRKQHGAGLGMALVAKIIEIHRAKMQIQSDSKSGTTISLTFKEVEGKADV